MDNEGGNMELPFEFKEKMKTLLGKEYEAYIESYNAPRLYGLRVNITKISVNDFLAICPFDVWQIPWIENGFYYDGAKVSPAKHPYYFAGLYYLQEPSAMTPANRLPIAEGDKVLDLCAAPGGKATELGAKLNDTGMLLANDISNSRAKGLLKNIELFGIGNVLVTSETPEKLVTYFEGYFDKILIDAPCSGEGMFRKDKKMVSEWSVRGPEYFAKIQQEILQSAVQMLRVGGMLFYSTCTFDVRENEEMIDFLLTHYPEFEVCEIRENEHFEKGITEATKSKNKELTKTARIWPHHLNGEGHYLALLKKAETQQGNEKARIIEETSKEIQKEKSRKRVLPNELVEFLADVSIEFEENRIEMIDEKAYYMPSDLPKTHGIRFLRTGLLLGELKKKRFEPSQALAMYLELSEYKKAISLPVTDERVVRYLKGETITLDDKEGFKGWNLIGVDGFALGWGKCANGMLKNKYAKGWRWE